MQFDQDFGPWCNDQITPRSRQNYSHKTSSNKNISEINTVQKNFHNINSTKRSQFPKLKLNNISPQVQTRRSSNNVSVKKKEEQAEQQTLPKLQNKALLQLKILRHRHTEINVVSQIENIIRRNLFYIPTRKYSMID
ncbi:unnamed protein product (macronuclear) [Paramecium tetraurelia]|uniref:Uncharacterized protein n=1 Tax=Paramecium tetraurelia TaxID=5888 RepID=A0EHY6_PARTE|nr:uncharacterized protein GSPATT00027254001 [Paramecium tetraurelia]CAK94927.1 unnamed protein product [Paramecium tetraurelia]|eukprot:XP_001462300.1 hypothetical protein (macronuclear) [Paramecium tetraurelia strain d4-2]